MGSYFNHYFLPSAEDCQVYDLGILPATNHTADYYPSLEDFFEELREDCRRAHDALGVRTTTPSCVWPRPQDQTQSFPLSRARQRQRGTG